MTIRQDEDVRAVGLIGSPPMKAVAVPAVRPGEAAVGLILAVIDDAADSVEIQSKVATYALPAAVLIVKLTTADPHGMVSWEGRT